jgi:predicted nuclease of predicted toxin-antitoxin system
MSSKPVDQLQFLVDVNLPKRFQFFHSGRFLHVVDIDPFMKDKEIWDYALSNELVILTKDTDFYEMFLINDICPKVVFFKFGNLKLSDLHQYFQEFWPAIVNKLETSSFIIAHLDAITVIR